MSVQITQATAAPLGQDKKEKPDKAKGKASPPTPWAAPIAEQVALSLALDQALARWPREGQVGFVLPVGEWAGVLAVAAASLHSTELVFPGLRESRIALFRGMPLEAVLRQHLGLDAPDADPETSLAGHALPGTLADAARRVAAPAGAPGAHLAHAVGAAFAARLQGRREAVLALAGVSALEGDDCHAALNFATVYQAPVVLLFRAERGATARLAVERAGGYALPASFVSGDDLGGLRGKLSDALTAAREGRGPTLIEVGGPSTPRVEQSLTVAAAARCAQAFAAARQGRLPAVASLVRGVFAEVTAPLEEQRRDLRGEPVVSPEEI